MHSDQDERLMLAVAKGNLEAFNEIVLRHQNTAWKVAYRFLGDAMEAEDIAQEAFIKILEAAPRYQPKARFRTYLYQVIIRLCIDHTRKKHPAYTDEISGMPDHSPDPGEFLEDREHEIKIKKVLHSLPPHQKIAMILKYYEGLRYADIALAMKTSVKSVEGLIRRARVTLQTRLARLQNKK